MQDEAYAEFREKYLAHKKSYEEERGRLLSQHDQNIRLLEAKINNLVKSVEDGNAPSSLYARLKSLEADLEAARAKRLDIIPAAITLPKGLPAYYRAHIDDLVETLSEEDVSGRASDAFPSLVGTVVVNWDAEAKVRELELRGELLAKLNAARPADEAGLAESESSLNLVAGAGFGLWRTFSAV